MNESNQNWLKKIQVLAVLVVYASNKVASLWASDTKNTPTCFGLHLLLDVKSRVVFYPGQVCL